MKLRLPSGGELAILWLLWAPLCLIGGVAIGGHTAGVIGVALAFAPMGMMLAWLWLCLVVAPRTTGQIAFALVFGTPLALWLFGKVIGAAVIGLSVAAWLGSRAVAAALERREVKRLSRAETYTGGLLIAPRRPRPDQLERR